MKFYVTDDNLPPFRFDFSISIIDRKFYIIYLRTFTKLEIVFTPFQIQ